MSWCYLTLSSNCINIFLRFHMVSWGIWMNCGKQFRDLQLTFSFTHSFINSLIHSSNLDYSQQLTRKEGRERKRWRESGRAEGKGEGWSCVEDRVIIIIFKSVMTKIKQNITHIIESTPCMCHALTEKYSWPGGYTENTLWSSELPCSSVPWLWSVSPCRHFSAFLFGTISLRLSLNLQIRGMAKTGISCPTPALWTGSLFHCPIFIFGLPWTNCKRTYSISIFQNC